MAQNILPFRKREYGCVQPAVQADISCAYACHTNQKNRYGGHQPMKLPHSLIPIDTIPTSPTTTTSKAMSPPPKRMDILCLSAGHNGQKNR